MAGPFSVTFSVLAGVVPMMAAWLSSAVPFSPWLVLVLMLATAVTDGAAEGWV